VRDFDTTDSPPRHHLGAVGFFMRWRWLRESRTPEGCFPEYSEQIIGIVLL
jgi:hypothetical protein